MKKFSKNFFMIGICIAFFLILYYLKSFAGINVFSCVHLSDFLSGQLFFDQQKQVALLRDFEPLPEDNKPVGENLLLGRWFISAMKGVKVEDQAGSLRINFINPEEINYYHIFQSCLIHPNQDYQVSGYIKTENLESQNGVCLEIQDGSLWMKTPSAICTNKISGTEDWQYVSAVYRTLPKAVVVKVYVRNIANEGPLQGEVFIKDVQLKRLSR